MTITCIANNGADGSVEVPLWLCPCAECTKLDWEALTSDGETLLLREHRHECFPEHWDASGKVIDRHPFAKLSDVQASATVGIGGGDTILCEIVYRSEGWVPRFTISNGEAGDQDARRQPFGQAVVTLGKFGLAPLTAETLLRHAEDMTKA